MLAAILGNSLVLVSIFASQSLRSRPSMILLCSLAFSDLAVGLIGQPIFVSRELTLNLYMVNISGVISIGLCAISLATMTLISVDRVLALQYHMSYKILVTTSRVIFTITFVWLFHVAVSCIWFFNVAALLYIANALIGTYSFVTVICYIYIYRIVRRHQSQVLMQQRAVQSFNTRANAHNMVSEKHIAFNTFVFFICTCFCYIPWFICRFSIGGKIFPKNSACIFTVTFIYVNSTINPLLYCWRLRELRAAVKNILAKIFCKQQG